MESLNTKIKDCEIIYNDFDSLNNFNTNKSELVIMHINIRSINKNILQLETFLNI